MTYTIQHTDGTRTITVQPGTVNGPSNDVLNNTDLNLYGRGTLNWGEGVDQNQLRLLESWACPEVRFGTNNENVRPANEGELGPANSGINRPVKGQIWFNTTDNKLYRCVDPDDGNDYQNPLWLTVAADEDLVLYKSGGTLTGQLTILNDAPQLILQSNNNTNTGDPGIIFRDSETMKGFIQLDQQLVVAGAAHPVTNIVQNQNADVNVDHIVIRKTIGSTFVNEIRLTDQAIITKASASNPDAAKIRTPATNAGDPGTTLTTKSYVDSTFVDVAGDTMTGQLAITDINANIRLDSTGTGSFIDLRAESDPSGRVSTRRAGTDDYFELSKVNAGGNVTNYIRLYDTHIGTNDPNGKIRTPWTAAGDDLSTLTTKSYVDEVNSNAITTAATAAASLYMLKTGNNDASGSHRFGFDYDDTRITGSEIKVTKGGGNDTRIEGPVIESRIETFTKSTTIRGNIITIKDESAPSLSETILDGKSIRIENEDPDGDVTARLVSKHTAAMYLQAGTSNTNANRSSRNSTLYFEGWSAALNTKYIGTRINSNFSKDEPSSLNIEFNPDNTFHKSSGHLIFGRSGSEWSHTTDNTTPNQQDVTTTRLVLKNDEVDTSNNPRGTVELSGTANDGHSYSVLAATSTGLSGFKITKPSTGTATTPTTVAGMLYNHNSDQVTVGLIGKDIYGAYSNGALGNSNFVFAKSGGITSNRRINYIPNLWTEDIGIDDTTTGYNQPAVTELLPWLVSSGQTQADLNYAKNGDIKIEGGNAYIAINNVWKLITYGAV